VAGATRHLALGALLACSVATACGGESIRNGEGDGGAGGSEAGGSDSGGSGPIGKGGMTSTGGSSSGAGGASGVGAASGTAGSVVVGGRGGTAGAGGEPSTCFLAPDPGPCEASIPRYAFNPDTGLCHPFTYGGCDGNANNFETVERCYATCGGQGEIESAACMTSLDCTLIPSRCCGACDEVTLQNIVAVNTSHTTVVVAQPSCATIDCVTCDPPPYHAWLGATCRENHCVAFDVRQTEFIVCTEDDDCRLRAGLGCCENCSPSPDEFVPVNRSPGLEAFVCGDDLVECDACAPAPPAGYSATCEGGRCGVSSIID